MNKADATTGQTLLEADSTPQVTVLASDVPRGASEVEKIATGVTIGLFAPYNTSVQLIADWTEWKPVNMVRSDDGWWRVTAELADGEYAYKFRVKSLSYFSVDQQVDIFDPYATAVTDDDSENTVLRVKDGKRIDTAYAWKHDDKPLPSNRDLIIYELHVGDFSGGNGDRGKNGDDDKGQFKHVVEKLDYLVDLGINCIELLPVKEFHGKGWGYSLRSLFAVENSYGRPEELCRLVDEAHARGIRVIIDGVYNHADADAPLAKLDYEYWFYNPNPDPDYLNWGPKFNFSHFDENLNVFPARKYVCESIQFWVEAFHIDGIRFDATRAISYFDVLRFLADVGHDAVGGIKPFFTVAEHVPEDPAITGRESGAPMDAAWQDGLARLLQAIIMVREHDGNAPTDLDALAGKLDPGRNGYRHGDRFVNFIGNHDFSRILHLLAQNANTFDEVAFRRVKLGTAILLTAPGVPMLWMGHEFGFSAEKSLEPRPLDWTLIGGERNNDLLEYHRKLIHCRREHPAFRSDGFEVILSDPGRLLFAYKRFDASGDLAVVVANLSDGAEADFELSDIGLPDGTYHETINDYDKVVTGGVLGDHLGLSEVKVFVKQG